MIGLTMVVALLFGLTLAGGWYFRRKEAGVLESGPIWDRLIANVNRLVTDDDVSDEIARDVAIFASLAGCGCFVFAMIRDVATGDIKKRYDQEREVPPQLRALSTAQKHLLGRVLYDLLMLDSLHMPLMGYVFRWMLKMSLGDAINDKHRAEIAGIQSVMFTAHHVAQKRLAQHKVPHQDLLATVRA